MKSYRNKKVFITGHTGFKGSWLSKWLEMAGAVVKGYSLSPKTNPNHFSLLKSDMESVIADIMDKNRLEKAINTFKPDIVFHLAAQPLVGYSYMNPYETYNTNVIGTLNVLEAVRKIKTVKAVVLITTDKVYENKECLLGYKEEDRLGGYDPYSSSKACCELLIGSYRNSYFNNSEYLKKHQTLIASARAGNVVGGGDWGKDRLIPDIVKKASLGNKVLIRNPNSVRPWQHVLESLSGYLLLGEKLLEKKPIFADAWNFGPLSTNDLSVRNISEITTKIWDKIKCEYNNTDTTSFHESNMLKLDSSKANNLLNWKPLWDGEQSIEKTMQWYKAFYNNNTIITEQQLNEYLVEANNKKLIWTQ